MAQLNAKSPLLAESAKVIEDPRDDLTPVSEYDKPKDELNDLASWILTRCSLWRDHRRTNYELLWDQYERLWRGMWSIDDKNKKSEKSTLVTPGLGEAVENIVAEVEEATWGNGDSFDMKAPFGSQEDAKKIVDDNKAKLKEDLTTAEFNVNVGEALINGAVYGTGLGEIIVETFTKREISAAAQQAMPNPMPDALQSAPGAMMGAPDVSAMGPMGAGQLPLPGMQPPMPNMASGTPSGTPMGANMPSASLEATVSERQVSFATLQSVNPRNFLIEPTARSVDKALGVAIEEYVGAHIINAGMRDGKYRKVSLGTSAGETQLGPDRQAENEYVFDKVHIIRYYGLVPKNLLFPPGQTVDLAAETPGEELGLAVRDAEATAEDQGSANEVVVDLGVGETAVSGKDSQEPIDAEMVEAMVFIANQTVCIKAIENPFLMKDRPVVAFPWDIVPGRFWGRGVCEKGMVPQRVMDAEMRARIDALAFVSAPMMGMDASRLPRGFQLKVRPGRSILTNGDPNQVLRPMHFGQLDQSTFTHSQQLDQMIQRATGSLDVIALAQKTGDNKSGAMSMMLSGIVKRHKRTLMNFLDRFYIPALRKILWRNMQYWPERYTPRNWDFVPGATMGIIQREYEAMTLTQLLASMDPESPEFKMILMGIVANTGLTARRDIIGMLQQSIQTAQMNAATAAQQAADPQTQALQAQLGQVGLQLQIAEGNAKIRELNSRANLQDVKARNAQLEPQFRTMEVATKGIYQVQADQQDREFNRRMDMADRILKARDIASNERIAATQSQASLASERVRAMGQIAASHNQASGDTASAIAQAAAAQAKAQPKPVPVPVPVPVRPAAPRPMILGRRAQILP